MSFLVRLPEHLYQRDALSGLTGGDFHLGTARALCWLSQLAYEDEEEKVDRVLRIWGLERTASFRRPVTSVLPLAVSRGFIAEGRGFLFVVFAGTDPLAATDWAIDLDVSHNAGGIHRGFARAMEAAWAQIGGKLTELGSASPPVLMAGHSLGGALAALFAQHFSKRSGRAPDGIYTFGMPRLGSEKFARQFNHELGQITYRLVHADDIVARVPPSELGYRHVGRSLLSRRGDRFDATLISRQPSDEPPFAAPPPLEEGLAQPDEALAAAGPRTDALGLLSRLLPSPIADHLPHRYWRALQPP